MSYRLKDILIFACGMKYFLFSCSRCSILPCEKRIKTKFPTIQLHESRQKGVIAKIIKVLILPSFMSPKPWKLFRSPYKNSLKNLKNFLRIESLQISLLSQVGRAGRLFVQDVPQVNGLN